MEPNKNNSREVFNLYNDLTCAIKNSDMEEKNIIVGVLNDFFCKCWSEIGEENSYFKRNESESKTTQFFLQTKRKNIKYNRIAKNQF